MRTLDIKQFEALAGHKPGRSISIFLPVHTAGVEVLNEEDQRTFRNQLRAIEHTLEKEGMAPAEISSFMEPLHQLRKDPDLWRHLSKGLAVFATADELHYFTLPLSFKPFFYVSHEFYLKPLLPLFMGDGDFYLLTLNLHEVKLYSGNREGMEEVAFEPPLPQQLEEVVGFDFAQKSMGYHALKMGGQSRAIFHGHDEWEGGEKDEVLRFFRAVDKTIAPVLKTSNSPLIVAALDYQMSLFREANTYPFLFPESLLGSPKHMSPADLHQKAWQALAFHFDEERRQHAELLSQLRDTDRTATDIQDIIPAAIGGRVEALFLDADNEQWGVYEPSTASVRVDEGQQPSNTSLTNLAAVQVFLNRGKVYLQSGETLPLPYAPANALFRY